MPKTSAGQETDSNQPSLFDEPGQSNAEDPQPNNGSSDGPPRANPDIAGQNQNQQTEGSMPGAVHPRSTGNPTGTDAAGTQTAVELVESEPPRETPPIGELTHSSLQSGTDGLDGNPAIGAAEDHPDTSNAVVNGYAPHAGDQSVRVPVTEATGSRTDALREPEEADRSALEAQNGEPQNDGREESGGGDESGRVGALDEDSATEASSGATDSTISPDPAAVATTADSLEGSGTNQPAGPDQHGTVPSNGTTIGPGADPKKGAPYTRLSDKIHEKVSQTKIAPGTRTAKFLFIDSPYDLRILDHVRLEQLAVREMSRSKHTLGVAITYREGNPHFRYHYSVLGMNQNGLPDFPDFARTLETLRAKEISTDPITGWKYPRTWEEAQVRSEREIRQVEERRRVNIEGYL